MPQTLAPRPKIMFFGSSPAVNMRAGDQEYFGFGGEALGFQISVKPAPITKGTTIGKAILEEKQLIRKNGSLSRSLGTVSLKALLGDGPPPAVSQSTSSSSRVVFGVGGESTVFLPKTQFGQNQADDLPCIWTSTPTVPSRAGAAPCISWTSSIVPKPVPGEDAPSGKSSHAYPMAVRGGPRDFVPRRHSASCVLLSNGGGSSSRFHTAGTAHHAGASRRSHFHGLSSAAAADVYGLTLHADGGGRRSARSSFRRPASQSTRGRAYSPVGWTAAEMPTALSSRCAVLSTLGAARPSHPGHVPVPKLALDSTRQSFFVCTPRWSDSECSSRHMDLGDYSDTDGGARPREEMSRELSNNGAEETASDAELIVPGVPKFKARTVKKEIVKIKPKWINFTQTSVRNRFHDGRSVYTTLNQLDSGEISVADIPKIWVVKNPKDDSLWSLNNRRLYTFKLFCPEEEIEVVDHVRPGTIRTGRWEHHEHEV